MKKLAYNIQKTKISYGTYTQWIITQLLQNCIWVSSNEVDETGAYYTEWGKPETETPIQYMNTYIYGI